ncbi:ATP-binding protein [Streptomyces luomodiensis]|uniref:ATP-binding protein n=1 Tax=Streptomyces luomodiensis TaxID=3026192 RepID=A0ABY9V9P1_9ACTN|nr:ATP-binding protein [Streptomyces sp. SCA4-21]WNF01372.1 ATP-binding protein [Streptomyces sp. SCA4-21]
MATDAARFTEALVDKAITRKAITRKAMICVHGHVGLGKTFAINAACRKLAPGATRWLQFAQSPNVAQIRAALWGALELPGPAPVNTACTCDEQIGHALAGDFHLLLLDEVQHLGPTALEYIRSLWDANDRTAKSLSIVFVGSGNIRQKVLHRPALYSRIHRWQQFSPLTTAEILTVIPTYHQLWKGAEEDLLFWIDDCAGHGCFRSWANLTVIIQDALDDDPNLTLSKDLVRRALSQLDPTARFPGDIGTGH